MSSIGSTKRLQGVTLLARRYFSLHCDQRLNSWNHGSTFSHWSPYQQLTLLILRLSISIGFTTLCKYFLDSFYFRYLHHDHQQYELLKYKGSRFFAYHPQFTFLYLNLFRIASSFLKCDRKYSNWKFSWEYEQPSLLCKYPKFRENEIMKLQDLNTAYLLLRYGMLVQDFDYQ